MSWRISLWTPLLSLTAIVYVAKADECFKPVMEGNMVLTDESLLKNHFPDGTQVTIECANGYEVDQGSHIITCEAGTWSKPTLICKKKDCGEPRPLPNMSFNLSAGTLFGALVQPICNEGYYLQGSAYMQCLVPGWSGRPKCLVITCLKPEEIANGEIIKQPNKDLPEYGDVIEYACNPGFNLVGNSYITCVAKRKYNYPAPQCIGITTTERTAPTTSISHDEAFNSNSNSITPTILSEKDDASPSTGFECMPYILVAIVIFIAVLAVIWIVVHFQKRKGSYDTGEALKLKEDLAQKLNL